MKLIQCRDLKKGDEQYVYSPAKAIAQIQSALFSYQKVEGLAELRRGLLVNHDHYVWQEIERGEWLLLKPEARSFDWKHFEKEYQEQQVMELLANPPPQPKPPSLIFRAHDSETGETIIKQNYFATVDGQRGVRRIDTQGFGNLPVSSKNGKISAELGPRY